MKSIVQHIVGTSIKYYVDHPLPADPIPANLPEANAGCTAARQYTAASTKNMNALSVAKKSSVSTAARADKSTSGLPDLGRSPPPLDTLPAWTSSSMLATPQRADADKSKGDNPTLGRTPHSGIQEDEKRKTTRSEKSSRKRSVVYAFQDPKPVDAVALEALPGLADLSREAPAEKVQGPSRHVYEGRSLFCLRPADTPRRAAIFLVESKLFDPFILAAIILNCVALAWRSPLDPERTWKEGFLNQCEAVFLGVFTFELLVRVLAYGFALTEEAYLKDPWCQVDFAVVALAWIPIAFPSFGNFSALRSVRALRPLRALKRVPGMPVLISSLLTALPPLASVVGLFGLLFFIFGIVGMESFKGVLHYRCAEPGYTSGEGQADFDDLAFCGGATVCAEGTTCQYFEENPVDGLISFDSVAMVFLQILQVVTFDTWTDAMWALSDAGMGFAWLYFVVLLVLGGFFFAQLFLAVLFDEFMKAHALQTKVTMATEFVAHQAKHVAQQGRQARVKSEGEEESLLISDKVDAPARIVCDCAPKWSWRRWLASAVESSSFSNASTALVVLNLVVMCLPYASQSEQYGRRLELISTALTVIFMVEMAVKLTGLGCRGYWSSGWNQLDGTIVLISAVDLGLPLISSGTDLANVTFLRVLRMLRLVRMLRLMKSWKELFRIVSAFMKSLPQIANLAILFFLTNVRK